MLINNNNQIFCQISYHHHQIDHESWSQEIQILILVSQMIDMFKMVVSRVESDHRMKFWGRNWLMIWFVESVAIEAEFLLGPDDERVKQELDRRTSAVTEKEPTESSNRWASQHTDLAEKCRYYARWSPIPIAFERKQAAIVSCWSC